MCRNRDKRDNSWLYGQGRGGWDEVGYGAVCDMRDIAQCTERMVMCCRSWLCDRRDKDEVGDGE